MKICDICGEEATKGLIIPFFDGLHSKDCDLCPRCFDEYIKRRDITLADMVKELLIDLAPSEEEEEPNEGDAETDIDDENTEEEDMNESER